jgi:type I restriction enzyme S subunit
MELNIDKTGWKKVKFGDVAIQQKGIVDIETTSLKRYIAGDHMSSNDLHLRRCGIVGDGYLGPAFIRKFDVGDILYGSRRTYLKKVAVADFEGITSNTTFVIKANTDKINTVLLSHLMLSDSFTEHSVKNSKGSVNPYINWKDIADYEFLLPPKDQQARLAELLWAADEVVEREREVKERLENASQLYFEQICNTRKEKSKLGKCLIVKKKKSKPPHQIEKYLGLEHIESGQFSTTVFSSSKDILADSFIFEKGDLLYSKLRPYLDKAIIADFNGICTTELIIYDTNTKAIKEYLLFILHSNDFLKYIIGKGFGTKMPRVSHEIVSDYDCYLPSIEEQKLILENLSKFKEPKSLLSEQIETGIKFKQGLINEIF